ncbi:small heat shock protein [Butyriboletus roseoflavus]|nr:small heat shock protein [Butyriboletus roseoflavus]
MSLIHFYYDPTTEFDRLFEDALAARSCPGPRACASSVTVARNPTSESGERDIYRPRLDLHESKDTNIVTATFELPGLTSEGVVIDVHQTHLTVSGESAGSNSQEERSYVVRERRSGKFSRTLQLPFGTKPEDVKAKMENGILTITFPKTSPEQQAKRILIQ